MSTATILTDIPIKFINATQSTDFQVVVFTKNFSVDTPETVYVAWQVIRVQTESDFVYSVKTAVAAIYSLGGQTDKMGPFDAELGSTWEIHQDEKQSTPTLQLVKADPNPNNTIVVKNMAPQTGAWPGRKYDVALYKNDKMLVTQKQLRVGMQSDLELQPKLFFGVVRQMHAGDTFTALNIVQVLTEFDLSKFPDGLKVTLSEKHDGGGQYKFTGEPME